MGSGFLGMNGDWFNSKIAMAVARCGYICVFMRPRSRILTHAFGVFPVVLLTLVACLGNMYAFISSCLMATVDYITGIDAVGFLIVLLAFTAGNSYVPVFAIPCIVHTFTRCFQYLARRGSDSTPLDPVCDIALALEWTQNNIEAFGGDKERITLLGYSSGGNALALYVLYALGHEGMSAPSLDLRWRQHVKKYVPRGFERIIFLSGVFDLRSLIAGPNAGLFTRAAGFFSGKLLRGLLGVPSGKCLQDRLSDFSPTVQVSRWRPSVKVPIVLINARHEFFGVEPLESSLGGSAAKRFASKLRERGAEVRELIVGHNHWSLAFFNLGFALESIL